MNRYVFSSAFRFARLFLLFTFISFFVLSCSYGRDNETKTAKDDRFQELCKIIDDALLNRDYQTAREILDEMAFYESCLPFQERAAQFGTDLFLCIQEDNYDDAILKYDRFLKANLDAIVEEGEALVVEFAGLGLYLYFVKQDHAEIGEFLANFLLTYYEKWMNEQKEDYKLEADDSLELKFAVLSAAFTFYCSRRDESGMKRAFSAMQKTTSYIDVRSYIANNPDPLISALQWCRLADGCLKYGRTLNVKMKKTNGEAELGPFMYDGCVAVPVILRGVVEEDKPIPGYEHHQEQTFAGGAVFYRKW